MNQIDSYTSVVVTDIKMPFWSMVIFMVKWAIAAIPALLLLAVIGIGATAVFTAALSSIGANKSTTTLTTPTYGLTPPTYGPVSGSPKQEPYAPNVPDRCKGSTELEKCVEQERRLSNETPEQRAKRQANLEAERKANMGKVQ